jgi:PAS domain-containing protein
MGPAGVATADQQGHAHAGGPDRQGALIIDEDGYVRVVSPLAEQIIGWDQRDLVGYPCSSVLRCEDARGRSLCEQCGLSTALGQRALVPPVVMHMADPAGARRPIDTSFWYLPPTGRFQLPRVMAVVRATDDGPTANPRTLEE